MNVSKLTSVLGENVSKPVVIMLPDHTYVPKHFHITEVGIVTKRFMDCGGSPRSITHCSLQVWVANDKHHQLNSRKLMQIVAKTLSTLQTDDAGYFDLLNLPVEVEYEDGTFGCYSLDDIEIKEDSFVFYLGAKHTECLALDKCGVSGCC